MPEKHKKGIEQSDEGVLTYYNEVLKESLTELDERTEKITLEINELIFSTCDKGHFKLNSTHTNNQLILIDANKTNNQALHRSGRPRIQHTIAVRRSVPAAVPQQHKHKLARRAFSFTNPSFYNRKLLPSLK